MSVNCCISITQPVAALSLHKSKNIVNCGVSRCEAAANRRLRPYRYSVRVPMPPYAGC